MTLQQLLVDYYQPLKGISDRTVAIYRFTLKAWSEFIGRQPTLDDFEELGVARFLAHRTRTREIATAAKDRCQIRALWEFAARRKLVDTWPQLPRIRVPERVPEAWLTEEMSKLLASAASEPGRIGDIPAGQYWRAALMLGYETGERIRALMELRWQHVRGCVVVFKAETRKGQTRDTLRDISVETADLLLSIKGDRGPCDLVLPWPYTETYIYHKLNRILKRAGLPTDRRSKFHRIRKTTASYYQAAGGSAQQLLDHSSPKTTRAYLDPRIVRTPSAPTLIPKVG